ncbi:DNA helicase [Croceibacterium mercuriale]|uniref:DNA 3'-5' helicase n=1 Tax=Croceibacterium mercuriale TaxID=1572751 RepID=A0A0B2BW28_9SPHN|nr:3'-5' exonuclease [Croceibacterium mercuriale]KHL24159.1 DNA helicase [Croceibacterium mercuriale]
MTLLLASTFNDALTRLSGAEQKQAKLTAFDLQLDPAGNGLQMHRIDSAPGFWSARVSQDIRIILHKDGGTTTLAWVDHHDDAYAWAERRRIVRHERTGAMQIVQLVERVEETPVVDAQPAPAFRAPAASKPVPQPFWALTDDQLLDVGVPRDWLQVVREMGEDALDVLFERLPAEAAEALYDFATGGRLEDHVAQAIAPGADPFAHPDAQRRFRVLDNLEELQAALDAPFDTWTVFLHPAQRELVERAVTGPTRVTGSAGTGKTIVGLHRAVRLARGDAMARVLLTTFSKPLADALERKLAILTEAESALRERIIVRPLDGAAVELYTSLHGQPNRATPSQIRAMIEEAKKAGLGGTLSAAFLCEEWEELVDAWGVADADAYATIPRIGRRTRLGPLQREAAWGVFAFVLRRLAERRLVTWSMIYAALTRWLEGGGAMPFDHVVVDEAQDLTVAQVRFLAAAGQGRSDALFLAGDIGQRIFRLPFSWAKLGLDVRGRSHSLKVNYRTSHQIRVVADRLLPPAITDMDGVEEGRRGTVSVFDGPVPEIVLAADETEERAAIAGWLRRCAADGIAAEETGLLVRGDGQLARARAAAKAAGLDPRDDAGVVITSMHGAKGLEFRAVAVIACDEDVLPDPTRLSAIGDIAEMEAAYETERHLLYVACTRARDRLLVSGVVPGSEFLDDLGEARG